jgi:hypothetical protein
MAAGDVTLDTSVCKFADWVLADWPDDQSDLEIIAGGMVTLF